MAQLVLCRAMGAAPQGIHARTSRIEDLVTFNRWLCLTRFRAAGAVAVFTLILAWVAPGSISLPHVLLVCVGLAVVSTVGLLLGAVARGPRTFFVLQSLADLLGITLGIGFSLHGGAALLFRGIYFLVIAPASLVSVPIGLAMAAAATLGHVSLLGFEQGWSLAMLVSVESLTPTFLFFLLAQQCFFYGSHLKGKNHALAALAAHLEEHRERLAAEGRMSAALLEVAGTLSSTLEAPQLLASVNRTAREQLAADWSGTFLVDTERGTFRMAAVTEAGLSELRGIELPMRGWPAVERLQHEGIVVDSGHDAEGTLMLFAPGQRLASAVLAGLHRDGRLDGFLAVGYAALPALEREGMLPLLAGIARQAAIALCNARLLEEVRRASDLKSEFVGAISHELRSPLNVILGYLEMVLDEGLGPISAEQARVLRQTERSALALLEMITALLDLNRLEAGRLPVDRGPVVVGMLLEDVRRELPPSWLRPEVEIRVEVKPNVPVLETDAGKLKTIVRNLVHNALKFTERGHVAITAARTITGGVTIAVADTGRGIPPESLGDVFEMFRQVPGTGGGGVGLGLHIVRRLLEVLGGTVNVRSEVGAGTTFTIILPGPGSVEDAGDTRAPRPGAPAHAA
jgi:signal transduction histidine kinase